MDFNADLIDDIARQRAVIFVGAGVSAGAKDANGKRVMGWEEFLRDAAGRVISASDRNTILAQIDRKDYLMACELLRRALADSWRDVLFEEFGRRLEPTPVHQALVGLKQRIVITTNFDKLLETAWDRFSEGNSHHPTVFTKVDSNVFKAFRDTRQYIIKIHGTVDDEESFIFTKGDFINKAFGSWAYSEFLSTLMLTHTLIFIGFSMDDPAISQLVETNARKFPGSRPHYIFQAKPVDQSIANINRSLRKIYSIEYDSANDHAELALLVDELGKKGLDRRLELGKTAMI